MANGPATDSNKSKSKARGKKSAATAPQTVPSDVCVYAWAQTDDGTAWSWTKEIVLPGTDPDAFVASCLAMGTHAVVGKVSIGAPEGPPAGWVDPDAPAAEAKPSKKVNADNAETEGKVLAAITKGARKLVEIVNISGLTSEVIDRALPRLRKAGHISHLKGIGWCLTASLADEPVTVMPAEPQPAGEKIPAPPVEVDAAEYLAEMLGEPSPALLETMEASNGVVIAIDTAAKKAAAKRAAKKANTEVQATTTTDALNTPPEVPKKGKKKSALDAAIAIAKGDTEEARTDPETGDQVIGAADADGVARPVEPGNFLLFVGGNFYDKDTFIAEAKQLGISRRMPSHRIPKDLVCGVSRVYVAAGGLRKAGEEDVNTSEVFGYFIPQRVEFVSLSDDKAHADIIAQLKLRPDSQVVSDTSAEPERHCGSRKDGGTYLVVDKADSPLHLLPKMATYEGNHFRGMMRLHPTQAAAFAGGETVTTLVDEICMVEGCGRKFKCAPDGHIRAERERRRIEKGGKAKWLNACGECRKKAMAEKAKARKAAAAGASDLIEESDDEGDEGGDPMMGTD